MSRLAVDAEKVYIMLVPRNLQITILSYITNREELLEIF